MDSVCADHCFTCIGYGSDHGRYGSDHGGYGSDLLDSIDRVGTKLAETLALVSTIQSQPNEQVTASHNRSTRLARASRPARLGTDLVVISTPEGRSAHRRPASMMGLWLSEYEASMENY